MRSGNAPGRNFGCFLFIFKEIYEIIVKRVVSPYSRLCSEMSVLPKEESRYLR